MNLWIDARMISCSGIGTVIKNLIKSLATPPFSTTIILHPNEIDKVKKPSLYKCKAFKAPYYSIQEQICLPRLIPHCDLFWSPHYNTPIFPIRAKKRIVTIHDVYHLAFKHLLGWKERFYAETMFRQAMNKSDQIITVSRFSQTELNRLLSVPYHRTKVIYNGVDFDRFATRSSPETTEILKKKYSLPSSFFLFVGNVKPHKNLSLILDAYQRHTIDIPLVVVGKKSGMRLTDHVAHRIENEKQLQKKIYLIGEVLDEELPAFYQMAVSLIFPSLYEGFGLPPLEAMASCCPAIVSSRASMPEVCGDAAYFISGDDSEELAEAMRKVSCDPVLKNALVEKGRLQAMKFSWSATADQYRRVFEETS